YFAVPTDIAAYDALGPRFAQAAPFFGPWSQYSNLQCAFWPVKAKHTNEPLTVNGAAPILLVVGTTDPATPYAEAKSVRRQIPGPRPRPCRRRRTCRRAASSPAGPGPGAESPASAGAPRRPDPSPARSAACAPRR